MHQKSTAGRNEKFITKVIDYAKACNLLLIERTTAVRRDDARQQEISHPLIRVDLIIDAREAMPFVVVDLVVDRATPFLDRVHDLQGFGLWAPGIMPARQ